MRSRGIMVLAALSAALVTGGWLVGRGLQGQGPGAGAGPRLFEQVVEHVSHYYVDSIGASAIYDKALSAERIRAHLTGNVIGYQNADPTQPNVVVSGWQIYDNKGRVVERFEPLELGGVSSLGVLSTPIGQHLDLGWVICHSFGMEQTYLQPLEVAMARSLAAQGFPVFRFQGTPGSRHSRHPHVRSVRHVAMLRDSVGYLDLYSFSNGSAREVQEGVDSLRALGAHTVLLDLRSNLGGLLDQGVSVADLFLDAKQPIVSIRGRTTEANHVFVDNAPASKTKGEPAASAGDVIVFTNPLVNGGRRIGRLYMHCTAVVAAPAANKASFGCEGVVGLGEGTLTIQVFLPHAGATVHGAVTGGTGTYANARGTLVSRHTKTGADDTISLVK